MISELKVWYNSCPHFSICKRYFPLSSFNIFSLIWFSAVEYDVLTCWLFGRQGEVFILLGVLWVPWICGWFLSLISENSRFITSSVAFSFFLLLIFPYKAIQCFAIFPTVLGNFFLYSIFLFAFQSGGNILGKKCLSGKVFQGSFCEHILKLSDSFLHCLSPLWANKRHFFVCYSISVF